MTAESIKFNLAQLFAVLALLLSGFTGVANAARTPVVCPTGTGLSQQGNNCKITICHATSALTNPYTRPTVDFSAADGKGDRGDHYSEHDDPVFNSNMQQGDEWGDIIPPIPGEHNGLNWNAEGQAIWNNGCNPVTPGRGAEETPPPAPVTTTQTPSTPAGGGRGAVTSVPQVTAVPQGPVAAGGGGGQSDAASLGAGLSIATLITGMALSVRRFFEFRV